MINLVFQVMTWKDERYLLLFFLSCKNYASYNSILAKCMGIIYSFESMYAHYLHYDDGCMSELINFFTLNLCSLLFASYTSTKQLKVKTMRCIQSKVVLLHTQLAKRVTTFLILLSSSGTTKRPLPELRASTSAPQRPFSALQSWDFSLCGVPPRAPQGRQGHSWASLLTSHHTHSGSLCSSHRRPFGTIHQLQIGCVHCCVPHIWTEVWHTESILGIVSSINICGCPRWTSSSSWYQKTVVSAFVELPVESNNHTNKYINILQYIINILIHCVI